MTLIEKTKEKLTELRNLLPFSEPKDPSSPLRGLARSGEAIVGQIQTGINRASLDLGAALGGAGARAGGGPVLVYQTINSGGEIDGGVVRRASRDGVVDAMRRSGR